MFPVSFQIPFHNDLKIIRDYRRHEGEQCVLLATGPSINEVDLELLDKHPFVCGVNGAYLLRNGFKYYFMSNWFYKNNYSSLHNVNAEKWYFRKDVRRFKDEPHLEKVYVKLDNRSLKKGIQMKRFQTNLLGTLSWGPTVILDIAIPVCLWMGFSEIILCGADYPLGEYRNFYTNQNGTPEQGNPVNNEMKMAHHGFNVMLEELEKQKRDVKFYNCSPFSELECFEKKQLEQVIRYT